jgi:hypothetical protein
MIGFRDDTSIVNNAVPQKTKVSESIYPDLINGYASGAHFLIPLNE